MFKDIDKQLHFSVIGHKSYIEQHMYVRVSQFWPVYDGSQIQAYPMGVSAHEPFRHGFELHRIPELVAGFAVDVVAGFAVDVVAGFAVDVVAGFAVDVVAGFTVDVIGFNI